jgi:hypothetical protein
MTELLTAPTRVDCDDDGRPRSVLLDGRMHAVESVLTRWRVETDWWRAIPVRRDYWRCLVAGGECIELCLDLATSAWEITRRYD